MRAYLATFRMRWKMETQYRGAALGGVFCQMFFGLILIAVYRALYAGRPQTLPLESVVSYVWLQQAFFRMLLSSDSELADKIRTGSARGLYHADIGDSARACHHVGKSGLDAGEGLKCAVVPDGDLDGVDAAGSYGGSQLDRGLRFLDLYHGENARGLDDIEGTCHSFTS